MTAHALDTLAIAGRLKAAGFSESQAEAMTFVLRDASYAGMSDAATKADVQAFRTESNGEFQAIRSDFKSDMQALRTELKSDMQTLRKELTADMQALRTELKSDMQALRKDLTADMHALRTELKSDMQALALSLEAKIEGGKAETIKWVVSAIGFQTLVLVGAVVAMTRVFQP